MDRMLQFFAYEHLPAHLQAVSRPFGELARSMVETLPMNPERTAGLRKLLEAKDCAVRALLYKDERQTHGVSPQGPVPPPHGGPIGPPDAPAIPHLI